MGSKAHLIHHLAADELRRLYTTATDATERRHLQIIWLLTSARSAQFVAKVTGYTPRWISLIVGRYNRAGVAGLGDQRQFNPALGGCGHPANFATEPCLLNATWKSATGKPYGPLPSRTDTSTGCVSLPEHILVQRTEFVL